MAFEARLFCGLFFRSGIKSNWAELYRYFGLIIQCTTSFKVEKKKAYIQPTEFLWVFFFGSQNKRLFSCTTVTDWLLLSRQRVFTIRYVLSL